MEFFFENRQDCGLEDDPGTAGRVPHQLVKDDVYNGLFLSATTSVHANQR
jgi:hypothetical protein